MSIWLYPISEKAGRYFQLDDGSRVPVSLETFEELVETKRLTEDEWWYIAQNYDQVQLDDEVFIYTGDQNTGIIGYARVQDKRDKDWNVSLKFDLAKCRNLLDQPVPAAVVRRWISPRAAVRDLGPFQAKLRRYLPWSPKYNLKPTENVFRRLKLKPFRKIIVHTRGHQQRRLVHDELVRIAVNHLKASRFKVGTKNFGKLQTDLVAIRDKRVIILEAKSSELEEGRGEARQAFGQLYEYRWYFARSSHKKLEYCLWTVFENRPDKEVVRFLEDHGIAVSWVKKNRIQFSDISGKRFEQFTR